MKSTSKPGDRDKRVKLLGYQTYDQYLQGIEWKKTRIMFLHSPYATRVGHVLVCSKCWKPESPTLKLHIHHKTYKNLGSELMTDLLLVCETCHLSIHQTQSYKKKMWLPKPRKLQPKVVTKSKRVHTWTSHKRRI